MLGVVFTAACLCAVPSLQGQEEIKNVRIDLLTGPLEITAKNQGNIDRLISVRFNKKLLKEFKTDIGSWLDLLATYRGVDADYIVLRTNQGSGYAAELTCLC